MIPANECVPGLISVIVPVWHVEKYLARCLDSLLAQTYRQIEILLVNDGGTEGDTRICEEYAAKDPRIIYIYQENAGLSAARNTALTAARGEWIMFLDSDDFAYPTFCETPLKTVLTDGTDLCVFDLEGGPEGRAVYQDRSLTGAGIYTPEEILRVLVRGNIRGYVWNKIYRRTLFEGLTFPVGEYWEDDAVSHRLLGSARSCSVIHDILVFKEINPDSITERAFADQSDIKWVFIQRKKRYAYLKEHYPAVAESTRYEITCRACRYGIYEAALHNDREKVRDAARWLDEQQVIPTSGLLFSEKVMLWAMRHCYPLFRAGSVLYMKLLKSGIWKRLKQLKRLLRH